MIDARPDHRCIAAARLVNTLRTRHPHIDNAWAAAVTELDGYPATSSGAGRTRGRAITNDDDAVTLTTVEAAVAARERFTDARQAVHNWTHVILVTRRDVWLTTRRHATLQQLSMAVAVDPLEAVAWTLPRLTLDELDLEDIYAGVALIAAAAHEALRACDRIEGRRHTTATGQECSGARRDGADVPWQRRSRDPDNGWYNPDCTNLVDRHAPLCDTCYERERVWRIRNGLRPRDGAA